MEVDTYKPGNIENLNNTAVYKKGEGRTLCSPFCRFPIIPPGKLRRLQGGRHLSENVGFRERGEHEVRPYIDRYILPIARRTRSGVVG